MGESLLSRLQSLTKPDREVDGEIALKVGWTFQRMEGDRQPYWRKPGVTDWFMREPSGPPRYTERLDAVEPLVAAFYYVLAKGKTRPDEPLYGARICRPTGDPDDVISEAESDASAAIALLIAWAQMMESESALSTQETEEGRPND